VFTVYNFDVGFLVAAREEQQTQTDGGNS